MKRWRVRFVPGEGPPWMEGREATIFAERLVPPPGRPLATSREGTVALAEADGRIRAGFDLEAAWDYLLRERYRAPARPITRLLPFHYHRVPGGVRVAIRRSLTALQRGDFPDWPIDPSGELLRWAAGTPAPSWPGSRKLALVLTHDVDTAEGQRVAARLAESEARAGLVASYNFVTSTYPLDHVLLRDLVRAGHEIGWHSDRHDNRIAFDDAAGIRARIAGARDFIEEFGVEGFRSPSLCRTPLLLEIVGESFRWDSSVPDTGDGGGCATVFPYRLGPLLEIPVSVPQDADLLFRGYAWPAIVETWLEKAAWIASVGGVAVLNVHPDPHFSGSTDGLAAYAEFVERVRALEPWIATPRELRSLISEAVAA